MRLTRNVIYICLFLVGVGCLNVGKQVGLIPLTSLGLVCFGLILIIYGIALFHRKRLEFQLKKGDIGPHEVYTGLSAQLWGVYFGLMGIFVAAFAIAYGFYPGGPDKFWAALLGTSLGWGMVLILIGLMVAIEGVIHIIAGTAGHNVVLPASVGNCLERFGGGLAFLFGIALMVCGAVLAIAPGVFSQFIRRFF